METYSIIELYKMKKCLIKEGMSEEPLMQELMEEIKSREDMIFEDGMGAVVSSQPSSLAGATIGTNWSAGGGTEGSGDISSPFNAGTGTKFQQQKTPVMGYNHGSRTGKKSRVKKLDLKALKDVFAKRQDFTAGEKRAGEKKVMDFNDFIKKDMNTIKK